MQKALLIIDIQNDYFPFGKFPLWNSAATLNNIKQAIKAAYEKDVLVIHVQHIANPEIGISPFFNHGTEGVDIHPEILASAPDAPVVIKSFADSFIDTDLEEILLAHNIEELLVCGMMTQNCVTHTAISKSAERYKVTILPDCCTTVDQMIHGIALNALSTRVALVESGEAI